MNGDVVQIDGFGTVRVKKMNNTELVTTLEALAAMSQREPGNRGKGYVRNIIRQEVLSRMRK